jgi:hypothetical protein
MNNPTSLPPVSIITLKFRSGKKGSHGGVPWSSFVLCWWERERLAAAAGAAGLHALALADLHGGLVVDGGVAHGQEGLLDIAGVLGRGLEEGDAEAVCEFLRWLSVLLFVWATTAAFQITRTFATL